MLVIRREQMEVLRKSAMKQFVNTMRNSLRRHYPVLVEEKGNDALIKVIESTISKLAAIGIERECDVERYLYLNFSFGFALENYRKYPWVEEIISDQSLPGDLRVELLCRAAEERRETPI